MRTDSYVYKHVCDLNTEIFYIGIGSGRNYARSNSVKNRNKIWHNYVNKYGAWHAEIIMDNLTHKEACEMEIRMIADLGKMCNNTGRLTNISNGGDRTFWGVPMTDDRKEKIRQSNLGQKRSDETKYKMRIAKLGTTQSELTKQKRSAVTKGKPLSEAHKESLRKPKSPRSKEHCEHLSSRIISDKQRINQSAAAKQRYGNKWTGIFCENNEKTYVNYKDIEIDLKINTSHIPSVCNGKRSHTNGYKFKYVQ